LAEIGCQIVLVKNILIALTIVVSSTVASSKELKRESLGQGEAQKPPIIVNVPPLPKKTDKEIEQETKERAEKAKLDEKLVNLTGDLAYYTWGLFLATAALVLATVTLVGATVLLWRTALRQSRDARDFFTTQQRPWIL
jgi:hypothetical protein